MTPFLIACLAAACVTVVAPVSSPANDTNAIQRIERTDCPTDISTGTRLRLTVTGLPWHRRVVTVAGCTAEGLAVTAPRAETIPWSAIVRAETSRRADLRWPGLAAGMAGGVFLGRVLPLEEEGPCTYIPGSGTTCPMTSRAEAIFAGVALGTVAGYFGGMLIKFDRWRVVPGWRGGASVSLQVTF